MNELKKYAKWIGGLFSINLFFSLIIGWFLTGFSLNGLILDFGTAWILGAKIIGLVYIIQTVVGLFKANDAILDKKDVEVCVTVSN